MVQGSVKCTIHDSFKMSKYTAYDSAFAIGYPIGYPFIAMNYGPKCMGEPVT